MVGPDYKENEMLICGEGRERERERERSKNNKTKKQTVSLRNQPLDLWVTLAKALDVGQPVSGEWLR